MKKNMHVMEIIGNYLEQEGFILNTDKRSSWLWLKIIDEVRSEITITDMDGRLDLVFSSGGGTYSVVAGRFLRTLEEPRTKLSQWEYWKEQGDRKQLYINILHDMYDIIIKHYKRVLSELAEKYKKMIPNDRHRLIFKDKYEELAESYKIKYNTKNKDILEIVDIVMFQISLLFGASLEEAENTLLGLAAMLESSMQERYGGYREASDLGVILLVDVGRKKKCFNILLMVFNMWEDMNYFNNCRKEFREWYDEENTSV